MEEHKGTCTSCGGSDVNVNEENKCNKMCAKPTSENATLSAVPMETDTETNTDQEQSKIYNKNINSRNEAMRFAWLRSTNQQALTKSHNTSTIQRLLHLKRANTNNTFPVL